jgi:hypothetical protein
MTDSVKFFEPICTGVGCKRATKAPMATAMAMMPVPRSSRRRVLAVMSHLGGMACGGRWA